MSRLNSVDGQTLSPPPPAPKAAVTPKACKDSCQASALLNDTLTELAEQQSESLLGSDVVDQVQEASCLNGDLVNGSGKSESLDGELDDCGDASNDAGSDKKPAAHKEGDDNTSRDSLGDSAKKISSMRSGPGTPAGSNKIKDDVINDNSIVMNGGTSVVEGNEQDEEQEEEADVGLRKDLNGGVVDDLVEEVDAVDADVKVVRVVEVKVGKIALKKSPRVRRGRSRPGKRGRAK